MRISFYGALLLALALLLVSYSDGTPGIGRQVRTANSNFTSVDVIVNSVSADQFDHALAKINGAELENSARNEQTTIVHGVKTTHRPAL